MDYFAAAALTDAAYNLFICQYTLAGGAPVHRHFLLIGQTMLEELQENPLGPLVVIGIGGIDFPGPVKGETQALELVLEVGYIVLGDDFRVDVILDGIVLGGQTKGVPAHGIENIIAFHTALAGQNIQCGIGARMTHMQTLSRRIGEFHQRIELGLGVIIGGGKGIFLFPDILPFLFHCGKIVFHKIILPFQFVRSPQLGLTMFEISTSWASLHSRSSE